MQYEVDFTFLLKDDAAFIHSSKYVYDRNK
jgi:hypothetical protein